MPLEIVPDVATRGPLVATLCGLSAVLFRMALAVFAFERWIWQPKVLAGVTSKSGRRDLNPRPPEPHSGALPGCATSRFGKTYK